MSSRFQLKRNITSVLNANTPAEGEPWFDTERKELVIGDGYKKGGYRIPRQITPQEFGAVGDGVTDDTTAFQQWSAEVSLHGSGYVPKGDYLLLEGMEITGDCSVNVDEGANFDCTQGNFGITNPVVRMESKQASSVGGLSSNVTKGDLSVTLSDVGNLSPQDFFVIHSNEDFSWSPFRDYYRKGEILRVKSVSGNTITLEEPLRNSWTTTEDIVIYELNPIKVRWVGGKFKGDITQGGQNCIIMVGCADSYVETEANEFRQSGIGMAICVDSNVKLNGHEQFDDASLQYGVNMGSSKNCWMVNSTAITGRHGITVTASGFQIVVDGTLRDSRMPCYDSGARDSYLGSDNFHGADLHGAAENCGFINCVCATGAQLAGKNPYLIGCTLYQEEDAGGVMIDTREMYDNSVIIKDCTGYIKRENSFNQMIRIRNIDLEGGATVIDGLTFISDDGAILETSVIGIFSAQNATNKESSVLISDIKFVGNLDSDEKPQINISQTTGPGKAVSPQTWDLVSVADIKNLGVATDAGGAPVDAKQLVISNIHASKSKGYGISAIVNTSHNGLIGVKDSFVSGAGNSGVYVQNEGTGTTTAVLQNNTSIDNNRNGVIDGESFRLKGLDTVILSGNTLGNKNTTQQLYTINANGAVGTIYETNNAQPHSTLGKSVDASVTVINSIPAL